MTDSLDLPLLRSFVAAGQAGSFSAAAAQLGLTQPAVSQRIRRLEEATGLILFQRSTRGVVLTPDGELVMRYAERVLAVVRELEQALSPTDPLDGIRVGLLEDVAESGLTPVLSDFSVLHPAVALDVTTACDGDLRDGIGRGRFDLAIAEPRVFSKAPHGVRRRGRAPLHWTASPGTDLAERPLPLVLYRAPSGWRDAVVDSLAAAGIAWRPAFEASSLAALQAALRAGLGVGTVLPGTVPAGCVPIENGTDLPEPPSIELALFRRPDLPGTRPILELERLLWDTIGRSEGWGESMAG